MSDLSHIYAKLHENRYEHVIRARRERELQAENYKLRGILKEARGEITIYGGATQTTASVIARIDAALAE